MLSPREHLQHLWLPWREAADRCFSPSNAEAILQLPRFMARRCGHDRTQPAAIPRCCRPADRAGVLRVATYNIHKGVRGVGPRKRLEIHNLGLAVEALRRRPRVPAGGAAVPPAARRGASSAPRSAGRTQGQAEFLAPEGYEVAYRTNAVTRHGEHGNALLSRWPIGDIGHHDVSDHRFEQRGLLHVPVHWNGAHGARRGGALRARARAAACARCSGWPTSSQREVPADEPLVVAGDFNDWGERLDGPMRAHRPAARAWRRAPAQRARPTFPSLAPVFALDRFYLRGLACRSTMVPRGTAWARMSDHLPLVAELEPR